MNFLVGSINFAYDEFKAVSEVGIRFDANDEKGGNLNGYIRLTKAEYDGTDKSLEALGVLAKAKVVAELSKEDEPELEA